MGMGMDGWRAVVVAKIYIKKGRLLLGLLLLLMHHHDAFLVTHLSPRRDGRALFDPYATNT